MITFDYKHESVKKPVIEQDRVKVEGCVVVYSQKIIEQVLEKYPCSTIGKLELVTGDIPIYAIDFFGKKTAFYCSCKGGAMAVALLEEVRAKIDSPRYVVVGGCESLDEQKTRGKVIIPIECYRDEGTSYHYARATDYVDVEGAERAIDYMAENGIGYVCGRVWSTDGIYRQTHDIREQRKKSGCLGVEMESASIAAMAGYNEMQVYILLTDGTLEYNGEVCGENSIGLFEIGYSLVNSKD